MDTNNTNNMESKELLQSGLETLRAKQGFICDMDGVIYHGNRLLPGVKEFVDWLYRENKHFLFLTNSSERSPKELQQKLARVLDRVERVSGEAGDFFGDDQVELAFGGIFDHAVEVFALFRGDTGQALVNVPRHECPREIPSDQILIVGNLIAQ